MTDASLGDWVVDYEAVREASVKRYAVSEDSSSYSTFVHSQFNKLLETISRDCLNWAKSENKNLSDFVDLLDKSLCVIYSLRSCCTEEDYDFDEEKDVYKYYNFWKHDEFLLRKIIKDKQKPYIDKFDLANLVQTYLTLPFRSPSIEKILVDLLIASELSMFADQMFNPDEYAQSSPLKQLHPLWWFLVNIFINAVIFAGLGLASFNIGWEIIGTILISLFAIFTGIHFLCLPFSLFKYYKVRKKILSLIEEMNNVYYELNSTGPISARRVEKAAEAAAEKGAAWPAPLFALLDDIQKREGHF